MYVILTSKPGQFRTETGPGLRLLERWDYRYGSRSTARFDIAELSDPARRVTVVDETEPDGAVNHVPAKFLPQHPTLDGARAELQRLCSYGSVRAELHALPLPPEGAAT
ncbi:ferredoxin [Leptothrix discophora]|uniref:Ferredoxin n=1 Tax=Leptothrix discophora TaxID=89 RepID=A0ABT9G7I6_LEPDI|nr:ferredoxin [Leptothrix discophora]MDP4302440.1 ferredoxin [Leptothrix discophora]